MSVRPRDLQLSQVGALLLLPLVLGGCRSPDPVAGPCLAGGSSCAASQVPPGMRSELRGHRIVQYRWLRRPNRESGVPDVGLQADWRPIRLRR